MSDVSDAYRQWVAGLGVTHFVTLNFNAALTAHNGIVVEAQRTESGCVISIAPPSRRKPTTRPVTTPFVRELLSELDAAVHRELIHRKFHRLPHERRLLWVAALESADLNPHVHSAWRIPRELLMRFPKLWGSVGRRDLWQEVLSSGDSHVRLVDDGHAAGGYLVKQRPDLRGCGHVFLSSEFWPARCRPEIGGGAEQP